MKRKYSHNHDAHRKLVVPKTQTKDGKPDDPQKGDDVKELQRAINKRITNLKLPIRKLKIDGECGRQTVAAGRRVQRHLGVEHKGAGLSVYAQRRIRHPDTRTKAQVERGQRYREEHIKPAVKVHGNTVTGGDSPRERIVAAAMEAAHWYYTGKSHRFYSQPGTWTVEHCVTGEPHGCRSDCSEFVTSAYHSAGAPDPNGQNYTGGYTGTLVSFGHEIRRDQLRPGDYVIYGTGSGHHVELWVGNGDGKTPYSELAHHGSALRDRTVGHGSPPVDYGDIDMIAGARFFRCKALA